MGESSSIKTTHSLRNLSNLVLGPNATNKPRTCCVLRSVLPPHGGPKTFVVRRTSSFFSLEIGDVPAKPIFEDYRPH